MGAEQEKAQHLAGVGLEGILDEEAVAEALAHLLAADRDEAVVHPVTRQFVPRRAAGLCRFVLVVREEQVGPAAVDVDGVVLVGAEVLFDHRRALGVPARASPAEGGVKGDAVVADAFPQREIRRVALFGRTFDPLLGIGLVLAAVGEAEVAGVALGVEIDVAVRRPVGVAGVDKLGDEVGHHVEGFGRFWFERRAPHAQRRHVAVVGFGVGIGQFGDGDARLAGSGDDLVVDVGDVARIGHFVPLGFEDAPQQVEDQRAFGVSQVRVVVDRRPADIKRDFSGHERFEEAFGLGDTVKNMHAAAP